MERRAGEGGAVVREVGESCAVKGGEKDACGCEVLEWGGLREGGDVVELGVSWRGERTYRDGKGAGIDGRGFVWVFSLLIFCFL